MKIKCSLFIIVILFALSSGCTNDNFYRGTYEGLMLQSRYEERQSYEQYKREREKQLKIVNKQITEEQMAEELRNYNESLKMFSESQQEEASGEVTLSNDINDETLSPATEVPDEDD
jgi:hypothetical protein